MRFICSQSNCSPLQGICVALLLVINGGIIDNILLGLLWVSVIERERENVIRGRNGEADKREVERWRMREGRERKREREREGGRSEEHTSELQSR